MKCEFCGKDNSKENSHISPQGGKFFCKDIACIENYYLAKTAELEKEAKVWHNAWYDMRDIIGRLGLKYIIEPDYEANKKAISQ